MWSGDIENVTNTKIFAAIVYPARIETKKNKVYKIPEGHRLQLTILANSVHTGSLKYDPVPGLINPETLMVIPVPTVRGENRIRLIDMTKYPDFFDDIDMVFPNIKTDSFQDLISPDPETDTSVRSDYQVRIVPDLNGLENIVKQDLLDSVRRYYSSGFAFIVAKTTNSRANYNPIAYVHEVREDGRLFIPIRTYFRKRGSNPFSKYYSRTTDISNKKSPEDDVNEQIYGVLMADDAWMSIMAKRKDLEITREKLEIVRDYEIYIINFPRLTKNTILQKPGFRIIPGDLTRIVNFYSYVELPKLPRNIVFAQPQELFKIKIDNNSRYNFDLYI